MKTERVKDWMTRELITINKDTTLPEAHECMRKHNVRRLPVVDENGRLLGIITRGDVRGAEASDATSLSVWELNYLLSRLTVDKIMHKNVVVIHSEATIGEAAEIMLEYKVSGLPVVDDEKVVGIITESDIFRLVVRHQWNKEDTTVAH